MAVGQAAAAYLAGCRCLVDTSFKADVSGLSFLLTAELRRSVAVMFVGRRSARALISRGQAEMIFVPYFNGAIK